MIFSPAEQRAPQVPVRAARRAGRWCLAVVLLSAGALHLGGGASGQDVVHLRSSTARDVRSQLPCEVIDYTGEKLRVRLASGQEQEYPAERVVEIETNRSAEHLAGQQLFDEGKFSQAVPLLRSAFSSDERRWIRRELLAQLVWCYRELGQLEMAGDTFLVLWRSDPATPYFDCIPLSWTAAEPTSELQRKSREWLAQRDLPAAVLLGASHLLPTGDRPAALERLRGLTIGGDRRVVWLATAQLWRSEGSSASAEELDDWYLALEKVPEEVRAGPYYTLGKVFLERQQPQRAALLLLRVPLLYGRPGDLAAQALLDAGSALGTLGQPGEALQLYEELLARYPESRAAGEAKNRLEGRGAAARSRPGSTAIQNR